MGFWQTAVSNLSCATESGRFKKINKNRYVVVNSTYLNGYYLNKNDYYDKYIVDLFKDHLLTFFKNFYFCYIDVVFDTVLLLQNKS